MTAVPGSQGVASHNALPPVYQKTLQDVKKLALETDTIKKYHSTWQQFTNFCATRGLPCFPVTPEKVQLFTVHRCEMQGNAVSASQWASHIRQYSSIFYPSESIDWTSKDFREFDKITKGLRKSVGCTSKHAIALTGPTLRAAAAAMRAASLVQSASPLNGAMHTLACQPLLCTPSATYVWWTYIILLQQALLRPNEACNGALRVRDITFVAPSADNPEGLQIMLHGKDGSGTKGAKRRGTSEPEVTYVRARQDVLDAVGPTRALFHYFSLQRYPDRPFLTVPLPSGTLSDVAVTPAMLSNQIRTMLHACGCSHPEGYSARSTRSGRRTDLQDAGVDPDAVRVLGRWASAQGPKPYQHSTPAIMSRLPSGT